MRPLLLIFMFAVLLFQEKSKAQWLDSLQQLPSLELYNSHGKKRYDFTKNSLISLRTNFEKGSFLPSIIKDSAVVDYSLSGNVYKVEQNELFLRNTFIESYYTKNSSFLYMDQSYPQDSIIRININQINTITFQSKSEGVGRFLGGIGLGTLILSPLLALNTKNGNIELGTMGVYALAGTGMSVVGGFLSNWYRSPHYKIKEPLGKPNKKVHKTGAIKVH